MKDKDKETESPHSAALREAQRILAGPCPVSEQLGSREKCATCTLASTFIAETTDCICKGNWRAIVKDCEHLIGEEFRDRRGNVFTFFGVVHSDDDYYYGMHGAAGMRLLSCVTDLDGHEYKPLNGPQT